MKDKEYQLLKSKFLKAVANVPIPLRDEIIAVVDNENISWRVAEAEIKKDAPKSKVILEQLKKIGVV